MIIKSLDKVMLYLKRIKYHLSKKSSTVIAFFSPQPTLWLKAIAIVRVRPSVNSYLVRLQFFLALSQHFG